MDRGALVGEPAVSIKDVAKLAGVSIGTVSNVLTGKRAVNSELAKRVRAAAADLNYQPDRVASRLRGGKPRVVGVLVPDLMNPFFAALVASIEASAREDGYDIIVATSNGNAAEESMRLSTLLAWRPGGLVVVPCDDAFFSRNIIKRSGIPFVVADRVPDDLDADAVAIDNVAAGEASARHILDLGHRDVVVAASTMALRNIRQRYAGIEKAFRARNLAAPRLIELGLDFDVAAERLGSFAFNERWSSAFIALTNFGTLGVLSTLQQRGLRIPHDISVVGFDDYAWMGAVSPPLTSVRQPVEEMGRRVWAHLHGRIANSSASVEQTKLEGELIVRGSTRACLQSFGGGRAA